MISQLNGVIGGLRNIQHSGQPLEPLTSKLLDDMNFEYLEPRALRLGVYDSVERNTTLPEKSIDASESWLLNNSAHNSHASSARESLPTTNTLQFWINEDAFEDGIN